MGLIFQLILFVVKVLDNDNKETFQLILFVVKVLDNDNKETRTTTTMSVESY